MQIPRPETPRPPLRVLYYSPDSFGVGHLRRTLTLAGEFVARSPDAAALVVSGSACVSHFKAPERVSVVKLPTVTKDERGAYVSGNLPLTLEEVTRLRSDLILQAYRSFRPEAVVVDHHPLGLQGEVTALLDQAEADGARRILGLRDIIDSQEAVAKDWSGQAIRHALAHRYHRVCVYGSPEFFDTRSEYPVPAELAERVEFTGYVVGKPAADHERIESSRRKRVLVTTGGGQDGVQRVELYLDSIERGVDWSSIVVLGPLMNPGAAARLRDRAEALDHVYVHDAHPDLRCLLSASDAVVSMAGYNTCTEIIRSRVPSVLLPRVFPRQEQKIRAERLANLGLANTLAEPDADALREAVEAALVSNPDWERAPRLDGSARACDILLDELDAARRADAAPSSRSVRSREVS